MRLTFLIDECVSNQTVIFLQKIGYNVDKVQNLGLKEAEDKTIFKHAQKRKATLVTYDRGFGDIRRYPPSTHNGIIVIRAYDLKSIKKCHEVLKSLLEKEREFERTLFVVDERKYRKRKNHKLRTGLPDYLVK